ncbi:hypothetical protein GCM10022279_20090 [Comamonas faecalis]|uniref:DUF3072 domain-containing protein n=1 Tax=Comamonas faecalis TaxID=1387849 RepID=A0ABP7RES6_9BURK
MPRYTTDPGGPVPGSDGAGDHRDAARRGPLPAPLTRAQREAMQENLRRLRELDQHDSLNSRGSAPGTST